MPSPIDYEQIAQAQQNDPELQSLLSNSNIFHFKKINLPDCKKAIFCDLSTGTARPYIPKQFREHVFATLHNVSHSGARSTSKLVRTRFVWPSIGKDCTNWAKCCIPCQKSKIARHNKTPLGKFVDQTERFSHVHIDIVGPLPPSQNNYYCLTMIDRFTRWPEAVAIPDIRAETVAKQFYATWISRFGCPERLTTDQGRQFESALFRALSQLLGIKKLRTSPYHPQSNGLIEEFHRPMKATLKAYDTSEWAAALPTLLLGFRTAFKEDLRATSSELVYGQTIRLPGVFFDPTPTEATPQQLVEELRSHFGAFARANVEPRKESDVRPPSDADLHPRLCAARRRAQATPSTIRRTVSSPGEEGEDLRLGDKRRAAHHLDRQIEASVRRCRLTTHQSFNSSRPGSGNTAKYPLSGGALAIISTGSEQTARLDRLRADDNPCWLSAANTLSTSAVII
ncbi:hypothetical protein JTE90_009522 [Oedothorax gibbosus]|uniref:RNA-directed DNA polymerase n=1 Tax=Oedothorax gibbosus TaxID=931172 RepID=A0AAV6UVA4_9ARAC|nr:hypothetical protein JTE90_009522 [Oedothorax gibbosus]